MTEFKKISDTIDLIETSISDLEKGTSLAGSPSTVLTLDTTVEDVSQRLLKFVQRAAEQDPDKKMYGPKMVTQIQDAAAKFEGLKVRFEAVKPSIESARVARQAADAQARAAAEAEAEATLQREKEEAAARARAEESARQAALAAESARAEEARLAAERLRQEGEARKAAKEREASRKKEEEQKAKETAAAKAKAAAEDAERKAAEERKRKADELVALARGSASAAGGGAGAAAAGGGAAVVPVAGKVTEVHSLSDFHSCLSAAGDSVVLVDLYASWCGPCKRIAPELEAYAAACVREGRDVRVVKCDADKCADVGATLGIRAFPTFQVYWRRRLVSAVRGADMGGIRAAVDAALLQADETVTAEAVAASMDG